MTEPETLVQPIPVYFYEISSENASLVRMNPLKLISGVIGTFRQQKYKKFLKGSCQDSNHRLLVLNFHESQLFAQTL